MPSISIDSVTPIVGSGETLDGLRVTVTSVDNDAKAFDVKVTCVSGAGSSETVVFANVGSTLNPDFPVLTFPVGTPTTHEIDIPAFLLPDECVCDGQFTVTVGWTFEDESFHDSFNGTIDCDCPPVTFDAPSFSDCESGKRTVTVSAAIDAPSGTSVSIVWDFWGDGSGFSLPQQPDVAGRVTMPARQYPPGQHTLKVKFLQPQGCPPASLTINVPECPCPTIEDITVDPGDCNEDEGTREVTLIPSTQGDGIQSLTWNFGDGEEEGPLDPNDNPTGTVTHAYAAPGHGTSTYTVTLVLVGTNPNCVDTMQRSVEVTGCEGECPRFEETPTVERGECVDDGTRRRMHVTIPAVVGSGATEFRVNWGDGSPTEIEDISESEISHEYGPDDDYTIELTLLGPGDCSDTVTADISVPSCENEPISVVTDDPCHWWNPRCWDLCGGLLAFAIAALTAASGIVIIGFCTGNAPLAIGSLGPFAVGFAAMMLWLRLCSSSSDAFCRTLNSVINTVRWIAAAHALLLLLLGILGGLPCAVGVIASFGYWGSVYLILVEWAKRLGCLVEADG